MHRHSGYVRGAATKEAGAATTEALPLPTPSPLPSATVDAAMVTWQTLHTGLAPIIGQRGVAALIRRSLYLTRDAHPWLFPVCDTAAGHDLLAPLRSALLLQTAPEAASAHSALLGNFRDLLATLIGESLTERLLRPALDHTSSGPAAQDITP